VFFEKEFEAVPVVQRQVSVEIVLVRKRKPFFLSDLSKGFHMDWIVICEDSVEIEDQRPNHAKP
jgi:hypothetical protein